MTLAIRSLPLSPTEEMLAAAIDACQELNRTDRAVLRLIIRLEDQGFVHNRYAYLAQQLGKGHRTIKRCMSKLRHLGHVETEGRNGEPLEIRATLRWRSLWASTGVVHNLSIGVDKSCSQQSRMQLNCNNVAPVPSKSGPGTGATLPPVPPITKERRRRTAAELPPGFVRFFQRVAWHKGDGRTADQRVAELVRRVAPDGQIRIFRGEQWRRIERVQYVKRHTARTEFWEVIVSLYAEDLFGGVETVVMTRGYFDAATLAVNVAAARCIPVSAIPRSQWDAARGKSPQPSTAPVAGEELCHGR